MGPLAGPADGPVGRPGSGRPSTRGLTRRVGREITPPLVLVALLLAVWEVAGRSSRVLPPPTAVLRALRHSPGLGHHLATTLTETGIGTLVGVGGGLLIAGVIASVPLVRRAVQPLLIATQTVPIQVLAPLLVLWFGFGLAPKVVVVALVVFFPVAVNTVAGIESADAEHLDLVRSFGAGRADQLRHVLIPAALPGALAGLRISLTYAVAGAVLAEGIGATSGLGLSIARSRRAFRYDQVLAGTVVVTLISIALFSFVHLLDRLLCPWRRAELTPRKG